MSASKGRDWMEYPSFVAAALEHKRGNLTLQDLLDMAESIVRRELAGKVRKIDEGDELVWREDVLSLLTDTPENDK